jgi:AraC-like DNA-binding protein
VHAARRLVQLHFDRPPTLPELARRIGTNTNKLTQDFKALYGETIARYALRLRMENARRLLVDEGLPVSEVAYRVGYEHHSSFTGAFVGYWGASPSMIVAREATLHQAGKALHAAGAHGPRGH